MLRYNTTIEVIREGDVIKGYRSSEQERILLKTLSGRSDPEEVSYSGMVPLERIAAWTMVPQGNSYKKMPVKTFSHRDERDDHIFHDDSRSVSFVFPGTAPGAITHLEYRLGYPDARFMGGHFFGLSHPIEESTITLITDPDIEVEVLPFHIAENGLRSERTVKKGKVVTRYWVDSMPAVPREYSSPAYRYFAPHVQFLVKDKRNPSSGREEDVVRLYRWYYSTIKDALRTDDEVLAELSHELTLGLEDVHAKAARLYGWVQDHIKYVAVEDGMNGLIPFPAKEVYAARYGDCKGMSNLLYTLLHHAGCDAHVAWVGSRSLPYRYDELPTPAVDDHMIVAMRVDTGMVLMDGTCAQCPYGLPSGFIQGKQVLVAMDPENFLLTRAPVVPKERNLVSDSMFVHVRGNDLVGHGIIRYHGLVRTYMAAVFTARPLKEWNNIIRQDMMKGSNKFLVDSVRVTGLDQRNAPLEVVYYWRIPDAVTRVGKDLAFPVDLERPWSAYVFNKDRKLPVEFDNTELLEHVMVLQVPEGHSVTHLPPIVSYTHDKFGYRTTQQSTPQRVIRSTTYTIDTLLLPAAEVPAWRAMMAQREEEQNHSLVLTPDRP
ncbi:MAG: DUF3857 domain-containing protein [Flavobacteriales bacterium]|nr:DUF3857 domain-containing protein [Flavobacteriales bacterium]